MKRELEGAERERERLQRRIERPEKQNTRLRRELNAARRAGYRQAAPFAKALTSRPKRPSRRAGVQYGQPARRYRPTRVDVRHDIPLPPRCPACSRRVRSTGAATQLQEELPVPRVVVREFPVALGACQDCGRRVQGRHRLQTSDALRAAAVQLGPGLVASVVILNKHMGLSLGKIATLLRQHYDIRVSPSGFVPAVHRAARRAEPTYTELLRQIRNSPAVTPDETGWRVGGHLRWLWAAVAPKTTVYAIQPGRGYEEAANLLGPDFDRVLIRDGWAPYRRFTQATHQTCLAHRLRRGRALCRDHPRSRVAADIHASLKQPLRLRDDAGAGRLSRDGLRAAVEALAARLARRLTRSRPSRRRSALCGASDQGMDGAVQLPAHPRHRRHQLARRTAHSPRRRHPQGVWRQSLLARRGHATHPALGHPHRLPTSVQSARRDRGATSIAFATVAPELQGPAP